MNLVAGSAGDRVFGVAALQAPNVRWLIQVAREADAIDGCGGELRRVADLGGIRRVDVFLAGAVAGLACMSCRTPLLLGVDQVVRAFGDAFGDVFVA